MGLLSERSSLYTCQLLLHQQLPTRYNCLSAIVLRSESTKVHKIFSITFDSSAQLTFCLSTDCANIFLMQCIFLSSFRLIFPQIQIVYLAMCAFMISKLAM